MPHQDLKDAEAVLRAQDEGREVEFRFADGDGWMISSPEECAEYWVRQVLADGGQFRALIPASAPGDADLPPLPLGRSAEDWGGRDTGPCLYTDDQMRAYARAAIAALSASPAAVEAPQEGSWVAAGDVQRLVRELDVALNGEEGAAAQASLCDVVSQVKQHARTRGPLFASARPAAGVDGLLIERAKDRRDMLLNWRRQMPAVWYGNSTLDGAAKVIDELMLALAAAPTHPPVAHAPDAERLRELAAWVNAFVPVFKAERHATGIRTSHETDISRTAREVVEALKAFADATHPPVAHAPDGGYASGVNACIAWVEKRRHAFEEEFGRIDPSTNAMEFGSTAREEYDCELVEIEEGLRALLAAPSAAHAPGVGDGAEVVCDGVNLTIRCPPTVSTNYGQAQAQVGGDAVRGLVVTDETVRIALSAYYDMAPGIVCKYTTPGQHEGMKRALTAALGALPAAEGEKDAEKLRSFVSLVAAGPNAGCGCVPVCRCLEPASVVAWAENVRELAQGLAAATPDKGSDEALESQGYMLDHHEGIDNG